MVLLHHVLEFLVVLTAAHIVVAVHAPVRLCKVDPSAVGEMALRIVGVRDCSRRWLTIVVGHAAFNLVESDQVGVRQLHLALLVALVLGVARFAVVQVLRCLQIRLSLVNAQLAHVLIVKLGVHRGCNDSIFSLLRSTSRVEGVAGLHLGIHTGICLALHHEVVTGDPEVDEALLRFLHHLLVIRQRHCILAIVSTNSKIDWAS